MHASDFVGAVEIGERARDAQHAMVAARRKAHRVRRFAQQRQSTAVRARHIFEFGTRHRGVGPDMRQSDRGIAGGLAFARQRDALGDFTAAFGRRRQDEIGGGHRRHFDVQVDAIEQRSGKRVWYWAVQRVLGPRRQEKPGSLALPQRHGFIAATSMKRAG